MTALTSAQAFFVYCGTGCMVAFTAVALWAWVRSILIGK